MCGPVEMAVLSGGLSALQIYGEYQGAKAQVAAQEQTARNAYRAANAQMSALQTQRNQVAAQAVEKVTQDQLRAAQAVSAARVSAGEAGIAGVGVNRIVGDVGQQLGQEQAITQRNLMLEQGNIAAREENIQLGLADTIRQAQTPVKAPGLLDSALRIGMGAFGGYQAAGAMGLGSGFGVNAAGQLVEGVNPTLIQIGKGIVGAEGGITPITAAQAGAFKAAGTETIRQQATLNFQKQISDNLTTKFNNMLQWR